MNTTTSDIDSLPRTPQTPQLNNDNDDDCDSPIVYSNDGLFKIPKIRNDSTASLSEHEYKIAQQTRSKVSLTGTPIEIIESTFLAPDAPIDIYDSIYDDDNDEWNEFLKNYNMPLCKCRI